MIGQCFEFLEAIITENNLILTFMAHRLAENAEIQERLYDECMEIRSRLGDEHLTYDDLSGMKYCEMVINEALRMCEITPELRRRATKKYVLENSNGCKVVVNPGDAIWMPVFTMQNDPKYFPNPTKFDPERFSDENRKSHVPGTYAPFGMGPRDCIGCQYVVAELKITFYYLLLNFKIDKVDNASKCDKFPIRFQRRMQIN